MHVLTKEGTKIDPPVLGVFTEASNWGALKMATNGLELAKTNRTCQCSKPPAGTKLQTDLRAQYRIADGVHTCTCN